MVSSRFFYSSTIQSGLPAFRPLNTRGIFAGKPYNTTMFSFDVQVSPLHFLSQFISFLSALSVARAGSADPSPTRTKSAQYTGRLCEQFKQNVPVWWALKTATLIGKASTAPHQTKSQSASQLRPKPTSRNAPRVSMSCYVRPSAP